MGKILYKSRIKKQTNLEPLMSLLPGHIIKAELVFLIIFVSDGNVDNLMGVRKRSD